MAVSQSAQRFLPLAPVHSQSHSTPHCDCCKHYCRPTVALQLCPSSHLGAVLTLKRILDTDCFQIVYGHNTVTDEPGSPPRDQKSRKRKRDAISVAAAGDVAESGAVSEQDDECIAAKRPRSVNDVPSEPVDEGDDDECIVVEHPQGEFRAPSQSADEQDDECIVVEHPRGEGRAPSQSADERDDECIVVQYLRDADKAGCVDRGQDVLPSTSDVSEEESDSTTAPPARNDGYSSPPPTAAQIVPVTLPNRNTSDEETEETEGRKWLATTLPVTPPSLRKKVESCASQLASPQILCYWRSILRAWRHDRHDLTVITTPSVTTAPASRPNRAADRLIDIWECSRSARQTQFSHLTFYRISIVKIFDIYHEVQKITQPRHGRTIQNIAKEHLLGWLYGVRRSAETEKEWVALGHMLQSAKRWALMRDAFGLGMLGLVPDTNLRSFLEQNLVEPQYVKWLQYIRMFYPHVVELATRLEPLLKMAIEGQRNSFPPTRLELWEGETVDLNRFGARWLEAAAPREALRTSSAPAPSDHPSTLKPPGSHLVLRSSVALPPRNSTDVLSIDAICQPRTVSLPSIHSICDLSKFRADLQR